MVGVVCNKVKGLLCLLHKRCVLTDKLGEATSGYSNWKKALQRFEQHSQSSSHQEALLKVQALKQPTVVSQLNSQHKKDQSAHRNMLVHVLLVKIPSQTGVNHQGKSHAIATTSG